MESDLDNKTMVQHFLLTLKNIVGGKFFMGESQLESDPYGEMVEEKSDCPPFFISYTHILKISSPSILYSF